MTVLDCLQLVHQSRSRQRYRIRSATPIQWQTLELQLRQGLAGEPLSWRLNRGASSLVLEHRSPHDGLSDGPDASALALRHGVQVLVSSLAASGATPPLPAVIQIHTRRRKQPRSLAGPIRTVLNALSGSASLLLILLAALLIVLGIVGLMLPLAPGAPLLLLAYGLVELALALRRPFVGAAAA
jgi:hypothetical protein